MAWSSRRLNTNKILLRLFIITGLLSVSQETVFAAVVSSIQDISFGVIDLHPAGDTITIAASGGPAQPAAVSLSVITGGGSGMITVISPAVEHVDITYPLAAPLTFGANSVFINEINTNSQYNVGGVDTLGSNIPLKISVGGKIIIPAGQAQGTYNGQITITLNFE